MLSRIFPMLLALSIAFGSFSANAQVLEEDDKSYIYKGFFISAEYGAFLNILKPASLKGENGGPSADLLGHLSGFDLGFDLADSFGLAFSFWATNTRGNAQKGGGSSAFLVSVSGLIHFALIGRLSIFGRLGAGLMLTTPAGILPIGVMAHLGLGLRYFTRMKHFSFGIEVRGLLRPPTSPQGLTLGIAIQPNLTYTF